MNRVLQGEVTHEVKVTRMKGHGYGVRVLVDGEVNQQTVVPSRDKFAEAARDMLRMEDKCGNLSDFADNARMRPGRKAAARRR